MDIKIPKSYSVGGQLIEIEEVEDHFDSTLGQCKLSSGKILLAKDQTESCKINSFVHEFIHSVLDTMSKSELSKDESFVCTMAGFICESLKSMKL